MHNANYSVSFNDNSYYLTFTAVSESYHECKQRVNGGPPVTLAGYTIVVAKRVNAIANDTVRLFVARKWCGNTPTYETFHLTNEFGLTTLATVSTIW